MNIYNVYRGPNPEVVQADGFAVDSAGGVTFWRYVPRPGSRVGARIKEPWAFYADVDKLLPVEIPEPPTAAEDKPGSGVLMVSAEEKEELAVLLLRCKNVVAQWERLSPLSMKRHLSLLENNVKALEALESRLQTELDDAWPTDDPSDDD